MLINLNLLSVISVFLVLILVRYAKIPRIDEIGHNLIDVEKSLHRTNVDVSFYEGFYVIAFQLLLVSGRS